MKLKIKKGSVVQVIAGSNKGEKGEVLAIDKTKLRIKVRGVKMMTHHDKKDGLVKKEGFMDYSNVKLVEKAPEKKRTTKKSAQKSA